MDDTDLPNFSEIVTNDNFKALPADQQKAASDQYWDAFATVHPDATEHVQQHKQLADSLIDLRQKAADSPAVTKRILQAQEDDHIFRLGLGDMAANGAEPDELNELSRQRQEVAGPQHEQLAKVNKLSDPEQQKKFYDTLQIGGELAKQAGMFGESSSFIQGVGKMMGSEDTQTRAKQQYAATKTALGNQYGLQPDEIDDLVKHQMNVQAKGVSKDVLGQIHIKPSLIDKSGNDLIDAISKSDLSKDEKDKMYIETPQKVAIYKESVVQDTIKNKPELAKYIGLTGDLKTDWPKIDKAVNKSDLGQLADAALTESVQGLSTKALGLAAKAEAGSPIARANKLVADVQGKTLDKSFIQQQADEAATRKKMSDDLLSLSHEVQRKKLDIFGSDAANIGKAVGQLSEMAVVGAMTGGLGDVVVSAKKIQDAGTFAKVALKAAHGFAEETPMAAYFGTNAGIDSYQAAKKAGFSESDSKQLGLVSFGINMAAFPLVKAVTGSGATDIAKSLTDTTVKQQVEKSLTKTLVDLGLDTVKGTTGPTAQMVAVSALNTAMVEAQINPNMTQQEFKESILNTFTSMGIVSGLMSGSHALMKAGETPIKQSAKEAILNPPKVLDQTGQPIPEAATPHGDQPFTVDSIPKTPPPTTNEPIEEGSPEPKAPAADVSTGPAPSAPSEPIQPSGGPAGPEAQRGTGTQTPEAGQTAELTGEALIKQRREANKAKFDAQLEELLNKHSVTLTPEAKAKHEEATAAVESVAAAAKLADNVDPSLETAKALEDQISKAADKATEKAAETPTTKADGQDASKATTNADAEGQGQREVLTPPAAGSETAPAAEAPLVKKTPAEKRRETIAAKKAAKEPKPESAAPAPEPVSKERNGELAAATYTDPKTGEVFTGANHTEAAAKAGVTAPDTREGRETPEYGFQTTKGDVISREDAAQLARETGQLHEEPASGKLHSDQTELAGVTPEERKAAEKGDIKPVKLDEIPDELHDQVTPEQIEEYSTKGLHDLGETVTEYLRRVICG